MSLFFMGPGELSSDRSKNMKNGFCKMAFIDEKRESTVMQSSWLWQNGFHSLALVLFPLPVNDDAAVKTIDDESCSHGFAMHPHGWGASR